MSDTVNPQSAGGHALLIKFTWGVSESAAYTSWTDPITVGADTYISTVIGGPNIETRIGLTPAAQTGKIADEPWQLIMPKVTPLMQLARFCAWPTVSCTISEIDPNASPQAPLILWQGIVTQIWMNPKEAPGAIKFEVGGWRYLIAYPLGIESKTACSRTFGDKLCGVNLSLIQQTATIASISAHLIAAPSLTIPAGKPANYFSFGSVAYDGLSIPIIDGSAGVSSLRLLQVPPPEWVGVSALFTPGCDKSLMGGCTTYANTTRYYGLGIQKPSDSPFLGPR